MRVLPPLQTPYATAGGVASSRIRYQDQVPLAFAGRSRSHRLVEVMGVLSHAVVAMRMPDLAGGQACMWCVTRSPRSAPEMGHGGQGGLLPGMQAMKDAFAMRSNLGDPGLCAAGSVHGQGLCFDDMQPILADMLAPVYAGKLRWPLSLPPPHWPARLSSHATNPRCLRAAVVEEQGGALHTEPRPPAAEGGGNVFV